MPGGHTMYVAIVKTFRRLTLSLPVPRWAGLIPTNFEQQYLEIGKSKNCLHKEIF